MAVAPHVALPVVDASHVPGVRHRVREAAQAAGFDETDAHRAGLVATELATNLVKHTAHGGELLLRATTAAAEIELLSIDAGRGLADPRVSLSDGHSTSGSAGTGLGAVRRLSDDFDLYSQLGGGTVVLARLRPDRAPAAASRFTVAGVSVAMPGEDACGDAWTAAADRGRVSICVLDGLGHGEHPAAAAGAGIAAVERQPHLMPVEALGAVHDALRPTRGAAGLIASVDLGAATVTVAGVGNVALAIAAHEALRQAVSLGGILGHDVRQFREYRYPWHPGALLVAHTDGLISHWSLDAHPGLRQRHPAVIAAVLYREFRRGRDDVTVVVGREAA